MSGNRWPAVDPDIFTENADGTCDMPKTETLIKTAKRLKYGNTIIHDSKYGIFLCQ